MSHLMATYMPGIIEIAHASGVWVTDTQGNDYLDGFGGIAVTALGHAHPAITREISEQAARLMHCSNIFTIPAQQALGADLCQVAQMERAFFSNSGTEANECALKLTRLYAQQRNISNPIVISLEHSFHGRSMGALSLTGNVAIQKGFEPLTPGCIHVPYDDVPALADAIAKHPNCVAIFVESIQGEAGIRIPSADYLPALRALADQHQLLLVCDEIQTGMGRTGKWFGYQHSDVLPDIVTVAKALGNGFPIGACLARGEAAKLFTPGHHGTTFGGNPLACSVALKVMQIIKEHNLVERAGEVGEQLRTGLAAALQNNPHIREIRGQGMMVGIEFTQAPNEFPQAALSEGLLVVKAANNTIRLLPAYTISDAELAQLITRFSAAVTRWCTTLETA